MSVGESQASDEQLVEQSLGGDSQAFALLYDRHRERVYRLAYRFVANKTDALDLCQEIFVKAFESLASFRGQAKFTTWLTRIAANTCVDHRRHAQVRKAGELNPDIVKSDYRLPGHKKGPKPADVPEREELRASLDAAIAQLSPDHREVFVLHAVEGLTYDEIAGAVGCPIGTVMSRLHYARKHLRGLLAGLNKD
jgi:RNA polymerase sigma-70 factor, ECF subfamily